MKFFYCKKCIEPSTRPRMTFDKDGVCNACNLAEAQKTFDWSGRQDKLGQLCDKYRGSNGKGWDMIVPFSGGKDSYHIAYQMKYEYGMNPLLAKLAPLIPTKIGRQNDENIRDQGFDLIVIHPGREYVDLCWKGLVEQGRPQMGFVTGITTALVRLAIAYNIKWLQYGEEGEEIYGGRTDYHEHGFNRKWIVDVYFSGHDTNKHDVNSPWWDFPSQEELDKAGIFFTHWSTFAPWDGELHLATAKKMGFSYDPLPDDGVTGTATFTNYTSLDDPYMRSLHTHLMLLKFGFARVSHEASCEIRAGRMDREQAVRLVEQYDTFDCRPYWDKYCKLFNVSGLELEQAIESHANKAIVHKVGYWERLDRRWQLRPELKNFNIFKENAVEIDYDGGY